MLRVTLHVIYTSVLVVVSYTDIRRGIVPNRVSYPAILLATAAMFHGPGWQSALIGGGVAAAVFILPIILYGPDQAGVGDVKLGLFIGLIVGFPDVIWALAIAFGAGAAAALAGMVVGKLGRRSTMPFAPFLALGGIIVLWF